MISRLEGIRAEFKEAEDALRDCERLSLETAVPSINELRYAGKHLLDAIVAETEAERDSHLEKAERHCIRAKYDAKESILITLLEFLADFHDEGYTRKEIQRFLPDWEKYLADACAAQKLLETCGVAKDTVNVQGLDNAISKLRDIREILLSVTPKLDEIRNDEEKERVRIQQVGLDEERKALQKAREGEKRENDRRYYMSIGLTVFGILLTLTQIVMPLVKYLFSK